MEGPAPPTVQAPQTRAAAQPSLAVTRRAPDPLQLPVLVRGSVGGDTLKFTIIGSKVDKAEVKVERSNVGKTTPPDKEIRYPSLEEGKRVREKSGWVSLGQIVKMAPS